ncbi:MAG: hypothetical protein MZW92_12530 [Comamonadaceae bacterium]|nr:hypothetical protein [Comamonadaceae bacterium]
MRMSNQILIAGSLSQMMENGINSVTALQTVRERRLQRRLQGPSRRRRSPTSTTAGRFPRRSRKASSSTRSCRA